MIEIHSMKAPWIAKVWRLSAWNMVGNALYLLYIVNEVTGAVVLVILVELILALVFRQIAHHFTFNRQDRREA